MRRNSTASANKHHVVDKHRAQGDAQMAELAALPDLRIEIDVLQQQDIGNSDTETDNDADREHGPALVGDRLCQWRCQKRQRTEQAERRDQGRHCRSPGTAR